MPLTPPISRVTLLARPTSVWIRMNALTTSTSSSGSRGIVRQPRTRREPTPHGLAEDGFAGPGGMGQGGRGQRDPRDGTSAERQEGGADVQRRRAEAIEHEPADPQARESARLPLPPFG